MSVDAGPPDAGTPDASVVTPQWVLETGITAAQLGILVNEADPQSVAVAAKYVQARGIPPKNVVRLSFTNTSTVMSVDEFGPLKAQADAIALDAGLQAWAITWTNPYQVSCMSIGTAFAVSFDAGFCSVPCSPTAYLPTYDDEGTPASGRSSHRPFDTLGIRPTMMLASGSGAATALAVIDRGVSSDGTNPVGDGYLVRTNDSARSVRWADYVYNTMPQWADGGLALRYIDQTSGGADSLSNASKVMFYFQSLADVPNISSNMYLPGAVADHLTSYGGQVPQSGQMSIMRWLEAGATASYGTVVEPCNYTTKFPNPSMLLSHYYRGEPIIEAYWKSVAMPGEGLFIGEPLARPWSSQQAFDSSTRTLRLTTTMMRPGFTYAIDSAPAPEGPWARVQSGIGVPRYQRATLTVPNATSPYYRLVRP